MPETSAAALPPLTMRPALLEYTVNHSFRSLEMFCSTNQDLAPQWHPYFTSDFHLSIPAKISRKKSGRKFVSHGILTCGFFEACICISTEVNQMFATMLHDLRRCRESLRDLFYFFIAVIFLQQIKRLYCWHLFC